MPAIPPHGTRHKQHFFYDQGYLFCEQRNVRDLQEQVEHSPFYLYSSQQIRDNHQAYHGALGEIPAILSYAVKANGNVTILRMLRELGCWATLVSGNELQLALHAGFDPRQTIFNGNGKTTQELRLGVSQGCLINIDSLFDLEHIHQVSLDLGKSARVLLRLNPDMDPGVHPHVSTGLRHSKFGIPPQDVPRILERLQHTPSLQLVGVHCHLGSTITDLAVYQMAMRKLSEVYQEIHRLGFPLQFINLGGGLGIDDPQHGEPVPQPAELVQAVQGMLPKGATLILEPGRSLIGNAGVLVCKVLGVKRTPARNFIVVDASMAELIRPCLYQAYHPIRFIQPVEGQTAIFDIVGPVCESADYLGKGRQMATPFEGAGLAIFNAGAYGYAMSSNYNARLRPPEYLVDGDQLTLIRRAESLEDHLRLFEVPAS